MDNLEKIVVSLKDSRPLVKIGWTGENQARGIVWDISTWQTMYGEGTCTLLNQRETDDAPYPCSITIDGKFAIWKVTDADLGTGGNGKCQLIYQVGEEVVAKSPVYKTLAERSLGGVTIVETPDWVLQVIQAGADAVDAAERAENAAKKAEDTADGATEAINSAATAGIQAVNAAGQAAIGAVGNAQTSAVSAVNDAKNTGVQAVNDAKETAVEAVQGAQTTALNAITEAQTQATEAVGTVGNQALQDISNATTSATSAVNTAGENAVNSVNSAGQAAIENAQTAITAAKNQAVSGVESAGQSAVEKIQEAQTAGVQAVEDAQADAVKTVQDAGTKEAEKISSILPVPTAEDAGKVPVVSPDGSGYELGEAGVQIDDTKTTPDTTWSSENIISQLCPPFEVSESIVTCNPIEGSTLNVLVQIEPVQEGTGDPSPENVRQIKGWEAVKLTHNEKEISIPLGQTVYGGTLDVGSGVLTVDRVLKTLSGSENWLLNFDESKSLYWHSIVLSDLEFADDLQVGKSISSHFKYGTNIENGFWFANLGKNLRIANNMSTVEEWKGYLISESSSGHPVQVVYYIATPVTLQLTPQEILALSGENTIYADTGNVTVSGYSDPTAIINSLADRIAALEHNAIGG